MISSGLHSNKIKKRESTEALNSKSLFTKKKKKEKEREIIILCLFYMLFTYYIPLFLKSRLSFLINSVLLAQVCTWTNRTELYMISRSYQWLGEWTGVWLSFTLKSSEHAQFKNHSLKYTALIVRQFVWIWKCYVK
jgi:hypothetical protein